jgi:phage terminase large subunit-like protein
MGLRGPGSTKLRLVRESLEENPRALPWEKKGLSRAARVIAFLEFLPITKGPLAGKRMRLLPDQRRFVEEIYRTGRNGLRKIRIGVKSEPKGNGKTGLVAGLCLCHLLGPEAELRGEIYSAAIDRQMAALIYSEMEAIILQVPEFSVQSNIVRWHKRIEVTSGRGDGSIYEAMSADARRAHGLSPSLFAYDELAQAKDRVLLDNLINGLGKRKEALGLVISTQAADDSHPLSQLIDDGLSGADPSIYVQLTAAPEGADPFAEATWLACNPALGKFLSLQEMREAAERARRIPAFEPAFRNLRLNQRIDAREDERLVTRKVWKDCAGPLRDDLAGRACYAALDLSGKHDLTSLTLVFPDDEAETAYDILPFFWTPEGAMETRRLREQELFGLWIKAGHMETVPGPVIRYRYMAAKIGELRQRYDIRAIAYDRWRIDDFKVDMTDEGIEDLPLEPFGQGFKEMAPAIEYFAELALSGRLRHAGHPVLQACVTNAIMVSDPAGNLKIDKDSSSNSAPLRIDGAVTLVMALGLAKRIEGVPTVDVTTMVA